MHLVRHLLLQITFSYEWAKEKWHIWDIHGDSAILVLNRSNAIRLRVVRILQRLDRTTEIATYFIIAMHAWVQIWTPNSDAKIIINADNAFCKEASQKKALVQRLRTTCEIAISLTLRDVFSGNKSKYAALIIYESVIIIIMIMNRKLQWK